MSVLVTIPIDLYRVLEARCGAETSEFKLLKNAVIDEEQVIIRCDENAATRLRRWAIAICPEAADKISIAPDPPPPTRS